MTTLRIEAHRPQFSVFLIAFALLSALILGGAGGYLFKSRQVVPSSIAIGTLAVDRITGYPSAGADDQRILAFLKLSGYEGGGTVLASAVDCITGYPSGGADDLRILAFLRQSGYEGGGTAVHGGSAGGAP